MVVRSWSRTPSGLLPAGPSVGPATRPVYRETHPVRPGAVLAGAGVATGWLILCGLLASSARGYIAFTLVGGAIAWTGSVVLAQRGDRGVATGVALAAAVAVTVATVLAVVRWVTTGGPL